MRPFVSAVVMAVFLVSMINLAFHIQPAKSSGTIYIRADGTVEGTDKIQRDGNFYIFTDNINDSIVVERDSIVIDGAGYTLQGTGAPMSRGIDLTGRTNVTIQNTQIKNFHNGIGLYYSSDNNFSGNSIATNTYYGIWLAHSSNNSINGNNITNHSDGIRLEYSSYNIISGNNMTNNYSGILLHHSFSNNFSGNSITNNGYGILLYHASDHNGISGNDLTANIYAGMGLQESSNNSISGNNITNSDYGIGLISSSDNNGISENNIANNWHGIVLSGLSSSNNRFYHNDMIDNSQQVSVYSSGSTNAWDDGHPSGGNYWSDYAGGDADVDGIGDTPHVIDENNQDNYPLVSSYGYWCNPIPGDVNRDTRVDMRDIAYICSKFLTRPSSPNWNPVCDINGDGVVNMSDISITCSNFGKQYQ